MSTSTIKWAFALGAEGFLDGLVRAGQAAADVKGDPEHSATVIRGFVGREPDRFFGVTPDQAAAAYLHGLANPDAPTDGPTPVVTVEDATPG